MFPVSLYSSTREGSSLVRNGLRLAGARPLWPQWTLAGAYSVSSSLALVQATYISLRSSSNTSALCWA